MFHKEELYGFIGVHDKQSISLLEIKESYRRKGLALLFEHFMSCKQMDRKSFVFGEIIESNIASLTLQEKVGTCIGKELTNCYFT